FTPDGTALAYTTYLGGSQVDIATGIAVDAAGDAYVTGDTGSKDFPTVNAFQNRNNDFASAFVAKFNTDGSRLVYSTYLGGSPHVIQQLVGGSGASGIAVDDSGNAYVTGFTYCTDFPTTLTAFQRTNNAVGSKSPNAFVTEFNADGSELVYSTYLGGRRGAQA